MIKKFGKKDKPEKKKRDEDSFNNPFPGIRLHTDAAASEDSAFPGIRLHTEAFPGISLRSGTGSTQATPASGAVTPGGHLNSGSSGDLAEKTASALQGGNLGNAHQALGAIPGDSSSDDDDEERHIAAVESCVESVQGSRKYMEDAYVTVDSLDETFPELANMLEQTMSCGRNVSYYAVYDGHAGYRAAAHLRDNLHNNILQDNAFVNRKVEQALRNGFLKTDKQIIEASMKDGWKDGSCSAVAILIDDYFFVANTGDSEIVIGKRRKRRRNNRRIDDVAALTPEEIQNPSCTNVKLTTPVVAYDAIPVTYKHKVTNPEEQKRIEDAGGVVSFGRLFGDLAVARAFGDSEYKMPKATANYVSPEPYIKQVMLEENDEFAVLASDGVWDKLSHQEVIDIVAKFVEQKVQSGKAVAVHRTQPIPPPVPGAFPPPPINSTVDECLGGSEEEKTGVENAAAKDSEKSLEYPQSPSLASTSPPSSPNSHSSGNPHLDGELADKTADSEGGSCEKAKSETESERSSDKKEAEQKPADNSTTTAEKKEGETKEDEVNSEEKCDESTTPLSPSSKPSLARAAMMQRTKPAALVKNKKPKFKNTAKLNLLPLEELQSKNTNVCAQIVNEALKRGSQDNCTCIVVFFQWEQTDD